VKRRRRRQTELVQFTIDNQLWIEQESAEIQLLAEISSCMRCVLIISLSLVFAFCNQKQNSHVTTTERSTLLDTLRNESRSARLLFFRDFATSKISLLIKDAKDQKSIDTLLSFIGNEKKDTACYLFTGENPVGEIYFYKDTSMTVVLADLYFTLDSRCNGWYGGIDKSSPKFDLTPEGKSYLSETKNRLEQSWKK
jgi:hypothetical protein